MSSDTVIVSGGKAYEPGDESTKASNPFSTPDLQSAHSVLIVFVDNPNALHFELPINVGLILGRRSEKGDPPDIDLAPYGGFPAGVSRHHVRFVRDPEGLYIEDLGSTNGTFVNGQRVDPNERIFLTSGQALRIAQLHGWVYFEGN